MSDKRINVLVYSGTGAAPAAQHHALTTLRSLLSPHYAVLPISTSVLLNEPWASSCALLVFPGGGDLGYCRSLNGAGNALIRAYVEAGGRYLGLCAGGYYGSAKCEFEVGDRGMEVVGPRELAFFPGVCRGSVYKGFQYGSDTGTKAPKLRVKRSMFEGLDVEVPERLRCYANGGGVFVRTAKTGNEVEVLAEYEDEVDVDIDIRDAKAAVIYTRVGEGCAVLTGPHPEFAIENISPHARGLSSAVYAELYENDTPRDSFLRALLSKLGLQVTAQTRPLSALTPLHFVSSSASDVESLLKSLEDVSTTVDGEDYVKGEVDTFLIRQAEGAWSMTGLTRAALEIVSGAKHKALNDAREQEKDGEKSGHASPTDHAQTIKTIIFHPSLPSKQETPHFDHAAYFDVLAPSLQSSSSSQTSFGTPLLTTAVTTSTSTLLSSNPTVTSRLPAGTTFIAQTQLSGRGRGENVWVSPAGALMFTTVFKHSLADNVRAPIVFVQYLAAMAVVEAVKSYDVGTKSVYEDVPVRLKWPNDVYALAPQHVGQTTDENAEGWRERYVKIGGILVNTSFAGGDFTIVLGIGLNLDNAAPTTSLNALVSALNKQRSKERRMAPMARERLLAAIMNKFGELYDKFKTQGFAGELEGRYLDMWLHSRQVVTLETEGGARASIKGVSTDWGLLVAEEVDEGVTTNCEHAYSGQRRTFTLQSDSNSFDFFKGLLKRKT